MLEVVQRYIGCMTEMYKDVKVEGKKEEECRMKECHLQAPKHQEGEALPGEKV